MKSNSPYTVIFESTGFIAVNKSSGISIGGDRWDESKERLDSIISQDCGYGKIYTVHRIDRDTSGLVVFAKDQQTHKLLSGAFEERKIAKRYIAVVHGRPHWDETSCELALVPNGNKRHMTIIDKFRGKPSVTLFRRLGSAGNYSVLEVMPETGRIHQIRVHAASLGFPVVCDSLYGKETPVLLSSFKPGWRGKTNEEKPLLSRLGLHAMEITLPVEICEHTLKAPLPRDMAALIKQMEKRSGFKVEI